MTGTLKSSETSLLFQCILCLLLYHHFESKFLYLFKFTFEIILLLQCRSFQFTCPNPNKEKSQYEKNRGRQKTPIIIAIIAELKSKVGICRQSTDHLPMREIKDRVPIQYTRKNTRAGV